MTKVISGAFCSTCNNRGIVMTSKNLLDDDADWFDPCPDCSVVGLPHVANTTTVTGIETCSYCDRPARKNENLDFVCFRPTGSLLGNCVEDVHPRRTAQWRCSAPELNNSCFVHGWCDVCKEKKK